MTMKRFVVIPLLAGAMLAGVAQAGVSSDCKASFRPDVRESPQAVTLQEDGGDIFRFSYGGLEINGERMTLSARGMADAQAYEDGVRELMAEVRAISLEAVDIAVDAVEIAMTTVFGNGASDLSLDLRALRAELEEEIQTTENFSSAEFGDRIDERVNRIVDEAVPKMKGAGMRLALAAVLFGPEYVEKRVEGLDERIEEVVNQRASDLEARAEGLCSVLEQLEALESRLDEELPERYSLRFVRPN
ncbi:DUF2884 family protein [Natronospira bacteriovora]|uniref:DUF2884 family protein n=1 Tax=Natronospira bacteriovora TaxID=3069753 RepID=A0ABU0W4S4_9GAMM|nr:DUF2884 family protein [Natronospira sp. AB-CW4]MDQ2069019.1 DUF2884 family protein [Natronospira sp. AB-CW4]